MTDEERKAILESKIILLKTEKQEHENFVKTEEPPTIDAVKQIDDITPKLRDLHEQIAIQSQKLNKYLAIMKKNPQIAHAKSKITIIDNEITKLDAEKLSLEQ